MFSKQSKLRKKNQLGFSLIEVLITSMIIGIVSAIVVIRYGAFNSTVLLKNQAYEIALAVREAQVFTVSSRGQGNDFRDEYGIYIASPPTQEFVLFIDTTDDDQYTDDSEEIETLTIDSRFEITDLCLTNSSGTEDCDGTYLSIMFRRPDFDADLDSDSTPPGTITEGSITLSPADGTPLTRNIIVSSAGQISVE